MSRDVTNHTLSAFGDYVLPLGPCVPRIQSSPLRLTMPVRAEVCVCWLSLHRFSLAVGRCVPWSAPGWMRGSYMVKPRSRCRLPKPLEVFFRVYQGSRVFQRHGVQATFLQVSDNQASKVSEPFLTPLPHASLGLGSLCVTRPGPTSRSLYCSLSPFTSVSTRSPQTLPEKLHKVILLNVVNWVLM